jgi:hypothetical protein
MAMNIKHLAGAIAALSMTGVASMAQATTCLSTDVSPNATACSGFFDKNLLGGSPADLAAQKTDLALIGFDYDTSTFTSLQKLGPLSGSATLDFANLPVGTDYIGIHYGAGSIYGNATAFYAINVPAGTTSITLTAPKGSSDAVLFGTSGVPEPATWAMMLVGFGGLGVALRRSRQRAFA